jgi:methylmalonyl-CoA epimerase
MAAIRDLQTLRKDIDRIDSEIIALLGERLATCREIAGRKLQNGVPMMQPQRIEEIKVRNRAAAERHGLDAPFVQELFDAIVREACRIEVAAMAAAGASVHQSEQGFAQGAVRIDHVAIAVRNLEQAICTYQTAFGFEVVERRKVDGRRSGMDSAVMKAGGVTFVLVQGTSPESNVSRYIEHHGPGVQHVALEVLDMEKAHDDLVQRGCDLLTGVIRGGGLAQMFTRRDSNSGMQIEFIRRSNQTGFDEDNVRQLFEAMEREDMY